MDQFEQFPLFVKPLHLGSSIGVGPAADKKELKQRLVTVFELDSHALVEPCVSDLMEINVSVLGTAEGPRVSVVEIPVASEGTLTYEDKYLRGGKGDKGAPQRIEGMASLTRVIDPEDLDSRLKEQVTSYAKQAFEALQCNGVVRFDFIVDVAANQLYLNELNPLPGSLSYYLWVKSSPRTLYTEMLNDIIDGGFSRYETTISLKRDIWV